MTLPKQMAIVFGALALLMIVMVVLLANSQSGAPEPMSATEHLQLNECVELISVHDPKGGDSYLVASDKCGHSVAITKRF